jgi:AcrR family transcriptional regulator
MRQRLLEAATVVLRRNGYAGLRTEEVSRVAGVSRGAQLHHFPTKESLVLATTEHIFKASTDRGLGRATAALASSDPIEELIRDGMDFFFSDDFFVLLDLVLMGEKNRKIREHIYSVARTHRPAVEEAWLTVLQKSGMERERAETVLWLTLSIVRGLAIRSLWQPDRKLFRRLLDEWKALVSERFSGRSRNGRRAGVDVPMPTRRRP